MIFNFLKNCFQGTKTRSLSSIWVKKTFLSQNESNLEEEVFWWGEVWKRSKKIEWITSKIYFYLLIKVFFCQQMKLLIILFNRGSRTPGVNFINFLRTAFAHADHESVKKTVKLSVFLRFLDLRAQKLLVEHWWNWPVSIPKELDNKFW